MSPNGNHGRNKRLLGAAAAGLLLAGGGATVGLAAAAQRHAPQPTAVQAGTTGPARVAPRARGTGPARRALAPTPRTSALPAPRTLTLARSAPSSIAIPAIGVQSRLLTVGLTANGTLQVPPLYARPSKAAWYDGSPAPGQPGTSVIEGHVDNYQGPAVFFRLGALRPGDTADVTLTDGTVAVFRVTGVREYPKTGFPSISVYQDTTYPSLRLITCGGSFDNATHAYLSNVVVYATLVSAHQQHPAQ